MSAARAARAVNHKIAKHHAEHSFELELGKVRRLVPKIHVELFEGPHVLVEGDDFHLTQSLRWWDANYGIRIDDTLLMFRTRLDIAAWVAFDVRTDRDIDAGLRPERPPTGYPGANRPLQSATEQDLITATAQSTTTGGPDGPWTTDTQVTLVWNHHIVKVMQAYDKDGNFIGFVPVFQTLPGVNSP